MKHPRLFDAIPTGETITELRPLPSDPNLRSVRVGRRVVAHVRAADVEQLRLTVGQEWTADLSRDVERCVHLQRARKRAMALLSRRSLARSELRERLVSQEHAREIADEVLDELAADGWLNDERYAESIVHELTSRRPAGAKLLTERLTARGIDEPIARRVVARALDEHDPLHDAIVLANSKLRTLDRVSATTKARRIAGLLMRRGFEEEIVRTVLAQLDLPGEPDPDVAD
jgi:regulatory protein